MIKKAVQSFLERMLFGKPVSGDKIYEREVRIHTEHPDYQLDSEDNLEHYRNTHYNTLRLGH